MATIKIENKPIKYLSFFCSQQKKCIYTKEFLTYFDMMDNVNTCIHYDASVHLNLFNFR